jgi:hypothetical protein
MGMGQPLLWMQGSGVVVVVGGHQVLRWGSGAKGKLTSFVFWYLYQVQWAQTQWARLSVVCMGGGWVTMVVVVVVIVRGGV